MRSRLVRCLLRAALCVGLIAGMMGGPAGAQNAADFYGGRQITLMVGASPGGGYDAIGRAVARHLGQHIPGHPTIVVENTPGGGSISMSNRIYRQAPQDGTILGLVQRGVLLAQLTKEANAQFDLGKFNWIGSVSPVTSVVVAWHTAPVKTAQDLLAKQLIVGGTGVTSDLEATARLLNATIGSKLKIISGYPGTADVLLAMERGEVQGSADWSWQELKTTRADLLRDKKVNVVLQDGLAKAPDLPAVPLAIDHIRNETDREVARLYLGLKSVARPILAGPGVPADRVTALRAAFVALKSDPAYRADAEKLGLEEPTPSDKIDAFIALTKSASPQVGDRLAQILNPALR
jgi:tripartite-type tricarboxylate transporter receptor subunit TctC